MGFKKFLEKFLDGQKIGGNYVEFFVDPSSSEAREVSKNSLGGEAKLIYEPKSKKLYLYSHPEIHHQVAASQIGLDKDNIVHIFVQPTQKMIIFYRVVNKGDGVKVMTDKEIVDFDNNAKPKLENLYRGYNITDQFARTLDLEKLL